MPKVVRRSNESNEALLRRFRKSVTRSNLMTEVRRRRWHVSRSEVRRIERKKAMRRMRRRSTRPGTGTSSSSSYSSDNRR